MSCCILGRLMGLRHDLPLLRLAPPPPTAANQASARRVRRLLGNRHQLSVHQEISGHLRSAHFSIAHPAKARVPGTGGLRRMDTLVADASNFHTRNVRSCRTAVVTVRPRRGCPGARGQRTAAVAGNCLVRHSDPTRWWDASTVWPNVYRQSIAPKRFGREMLGSARSSPTFRSEDIPNSISEEVA